MVNCPNAWLFEIRTTKISRHRRWDADNIFDLLAVIPPHVGFHNLISGFRRECAGRLNHFSFVIDADEYKASSTVNAQWAVPTSYSDQFIMNSI
jgi:hypothetical protein